MHDVLKPETEADAVEIVRQFYQEGKSLEISGGNTRPDFGQPVKADQKLSSRSLSGIVSYNPSEMVMTAKAGTPLAEIDLALSENGQYLAFEPMDHRGIMGSYGDPTIGGVFAANVSGPRRFSLAGAARDHLLGVRFINGKGEIVRSGGRVMKNVTGLDLVKLMAGSYGTLGFMSEVTFKVLPAPKAAATVVLSDLSDEDAVKVMAAVMALPVEVSGAAHMPYSVIHRMLDGLLEGGAATCFRLEGLSESVAVRRDKLRDFLSEFGSVSVLAEDETRALWQAIRDVSPYSENHQTCLWRVSIAPSAGAALLSDMRLVAAVDAFYDWQGGLIWMALEGDAEADALRRLIRKHGGGHATLLRAPETVRSVTACFEPQPSPVAALSNRIKATFDPKGILNPGKMDKQETAA
ncbi:glycolate oxidase subunit GlcE [Martelella mediterranea]|uniref:Glycolate oxidase FAD binding subunit n=1 Tax=Martelella mediterranea TaxID=293089 RepID=A0A4R3NS59_9HYPH|nr:glycolate oxidase subunit GlcE [Martelella mediterranea]TCT38835.1 glycolate oxidase FAD binding subunit [Martelella mediterranea]